MGTNYYLHYPACPTCGQAPQRLHIGKSSAGWCFALHVDFKKGIHDLPDWETQFRKTGVRILDEYNQELSIAGMLSIITQRPCKRPPPDRSEDYPKIPHAESGPNGLLRAEVDGAVCVGHGNGTWDRITGEFS